MSQLVGAGVRRDERGIQGSCHVGIFSEQMIDALACELVPRVVVEQGTVKVVWKKGTRFRGVVCQNLAKLFYHRNMAFFAPFAVDEQMGGDGSLTHRAL